MERERTKNDRIAPPVEYQMWQCGSCRWQRDAMQFNVLKPACMALPKQVVSVGNTIACVSPIIENLQDGCSMWTPKPNGEDHGTS
jgi:hypothetical protein